MVCRRSEGPVTIDEQPAINDYIIISSWNGLNAGANLYYTYQKELGISKGEPFLSISHSHLIASIAFGSSFDPDIRQSSY